MTLGARLVGLVVIGASLAGARAACGQDQAAAMFGQPVVAVRFTIEGGDVTSPALVGLSDVRVGRALSQIDVRTTITHLDSLQRYDNVVPTATAVPGGVEITFALTPRHPITALEIRGDPGGSASALRSAMLQRYGGVPTSARPAAVAAAATQFLRDAGYARATVTATTEVSHDPEGATLVLTADAGPVTTIARTDVRGTSPFSPDEIIRRTGTSPGQPFKRRDVETAMSTIEDDLRGRGFYEAQLTLLPVEPADTVDLVINVDTGPRVELRVQPADQLPDDVDTLIPIKRLGAADRDLLEDSQRRIESALRAQGYWQARAPFQYERSADGQTLTIVFTITRGPRFFVDHIDWPSTLTLPEATLRDLVGVHDGDVFDEARFLRGLARVVDEYRRNGYYKLSATPDYEELGDRSSATRALVVIHPNVVEGPRGVVRAVTFDFGDGAHQVTEATLRQAMLQRVGRPYIEAEAAQDRTSLRTLYRDRGFLSAFVDVAPSFGEDGTAVSLAVTANEGPQIVIGQISVVGNQHVSEADILADLKLVPGQPAGDAVLSAAQERLVETGVFRRVTITPADQFGGEREAHLIVSVVENPRTTIGYGGGLEGGRYLRAAVGGGNEDYLGFAPRGFFEVTRRGLGGRDRSVNFFSRLALKRRFAPDDPTRDGRGFGFAEYRVATTYRERRAFGTDTDVLVGASFEQAVRTNFNFLRKGVNAEALRQVTSHISVTGRYALDFTRVFDNRISDDDPLQPLIDRLFPQVRISSLSAGLSWDRRDNLLSPTKGAFVTADAELAARGIGSEVGYVKTFVQGSLFHAIDASKKTVLAGRAEIGLARGFARAVPRVDENGQPVLDESGSQIIDVVQDLPASVRFFAGGSTTVRGFRLDSLGVPEILTADGLSLGGNAVVVLNGELRRVVGRLLGHDLIGVGFVDAGNVFAKVSTFDLSRIRGSAGVGVRYDSPLGPIRLDFGFKLHPEIVGGDRERGWEYHLSIGEAF
ncbi:MAG TPA: POTRA domain-containing protein [Vicinamibacterales bacterium]|jgi:outer membrane protein assembly factor BamA|nr:POTRA domain-containing protein [Vicinamibacterales bacterium]